MKSISNKALVSIVIPTHNRRESLERLLRSALVSSYTNIEIIVIDDASSDQTFEYIKKKFAKNNKIKIFRNKKNLYTAGTRNVGQKKAKGEFVLFIDDDNEIDPHMIREMVATFSKDETIGEVGPINYSYAKRNKILWARTNRNMWTSKTNQSRSLTQFRMLDSWSTDDVPNAFMVRRSIVVKNKIYFREEYGIMYEESDYAYRIRMNGYKIMVVRRAKIFHDVEEYFPDGKVKDYMYHFMNDKRRPFVFARNRILFHKLYSSRLQLIIILGFWVWFFSAYYMYRIISYSGYGNFSILKRIELAVSYLRGTFIGIFLIR